MAAEYLVNIAIGAGEDFTQRYYLTNADMSPLDITGAEITAYLAKHPGAFVAYESTSEDPVWAYYPFDCKVVDGPGGVFEIGMGYPTTSLLREGKYVYSVVAIDPADGIRTEMVSGLAFVDRSFGNVPTMGTIQPLPPTPF